MGTPINPTTTTTTTTAITTTQEFVLGMLNTGGQSPDNDAYFDKTMELFNLESKTSCRVNATLDRPIWTQWKWRFGVWR